MSYFGMYVLTKLDSWHEFTDCLGGASLIVSGLAFLIIIFVAGINSGYSDNFENLFPKYYKMFPIKRVAIIGIVLMILTQLLPTTKQAAFIYIAPQIIENGAVKDTVKNIPELTKLGTDYLKELLKEKVEEKTK